MDRTIHVTVNGEFVKKDSKNAGVRGEGNAAKLHITMSEDWRQYSKRLIWRNALGENPVSVLLYKSVAELVVTQAEGDGGETADPLVFDTPIPSEPMAVDGWCSFTIEGFRDSDPTAVAIAVTDYLLVKPNDSFGAPAEPTPTQAQQLQVQIDRITEETAAVVQEAVDALEQAERDMKVWEPWDSARTYLPLQKVYRLGSSYICKQTIHMKGVHMTIIKIEQNKNGSHDNNTIAGATPETFPVPEGWAVIPPELGVPETIPNYPFGEIVVNDTGDYPEVIQWTALPIPESEPEPGPGPTQLDRVEAQATYTAMMTDTLLKED